LTALRFPAEIAVGEVQWEDAREPGGWGHLLAIGVVKVPDGTAVRLEVSDVAEVSVSSRAVGWMAPAGTAPPQAVPPGPVRDRVTWQREMPDSALHNNRRIWGEPGESHRVKHGEEAVNLEFIRGLPADSILELSLSDVVPASFAAVAHLAPGLRGLDLFLDDLGDDAPSVIAELTALEYLCSRTSAWTDHTAIAGTRFGQPRRAQSHQRSLRCALSWPNSHLCRRRARTAVPRAGQADDW
jgi:hypothetical protein